MVGVLVRALFAQNCGILYKGDTTEAWRSFGIQLLGALVIIVWATVWSSLVFGTLKWFNILRIEDYDEYFGLDLTHHGESAYPAAAWNEVQYQGNQQTGERRIGPMENQVNNVHGQRDNEVDLGPYGGDISEDVNQLENEFSSFLHRPSVTRLSNTARASKLAVKFGR